MIIPLAEHERYDVTLIALMDVITTALIERAKPKTRRYNQLQSWKARIETNTNRHPNCDGSPWGWYEVWPLDTLVGYWSGWGKEERDDLKDVDIDAFNAALAELDK